MTGVDTGVARPQLVEEIAEILADRIPDLDRATAGALAREHAARTNSAGELRAYLRERTRVLDSAHSDVPISLIRIAHHLADAGTVPIVVPTCLDCARPLISLPNRVEGGRICVGCRGRRGRPRCWECGEQAFLRADQRVCQPCRKRLKPPEACGGCGRVVKKMTRRLPDGTGLCQNCHQPAEQCGACGRTARVYQRAEDGTARCRRCYQQPTIRCAGCGKDREVRKRTERGPLCPACYRREGAPRHECGRCGRIAPWAARPRDGEPGYCERCYQRPVSPCMVCGRTRPVQRRAAFDRALVCDPCGVSATPQE